jgi:hypothetical protein
MPGYLDTVEAQLAALTHEGVDRSTGPTVVREPLRHGGAQADDAPPPGGNGLFARLTGGRGSAGGPGGPRRRRNREALAVVPALLIALIVVVGLLAFGLGANHNTAKHSSSTTTAPPARHRHQRASHTSTAPRLSTHAPASATAARHVQAPAGPVPPGFGPESFTAISPSTWWLLGAAPCSSPPCTSVLRTDDGGHSFVGTPAPRTTRVSELRFANAADGFAYNPQLWVTHDGGAQWHQVRLGGAITEVAAANGFAYAIVRYGHKGQGRLERSALGSDTWATLPAAGSAYAGLWAHGQDVLVGSGGGTGLVVSHNAGVNFAQESSPSKGLPCDFEEPATAVVWAHCATGTESATWRSADSGGHFSATTGPSMPNSALFAAASPSTAVLGATQLYRTTDQGGHYAPVSDLGPVTAWQYLGFTDPTHGVAIGYVGSTPTPGNERLYYTSDGGATYHLVSTG